jgi:hypothetical protein
MPTLAHKIGQDGIMLSLGQAYRYIERQVHLYFAPVVVHS